MKAPPMAGLSLHAGLVASLSCHPAQAGIRFQPTQLLALTALRFPAFLSAPKVSSQSRVKGLATKTEE